MLRSRASCSNDRSLSASVSHPLYHTRFHVCKPLSSAFQQDVQLRLDTPEDAKRKSRQSNNGKDGLKGSFGKDESAPSQGRRGQKLGNLGQLAAAESLILDEQTYSGRLPDHSSSGGEDYAELPVDDEPFEPITKISVPRQKYIPVSKVSLVNALADSYNDQKKASDFLVICSLLDFILHAEHKTTLEQMRLDYKMTQSALEKEARHTNKAKLVDKQKARKRKGLLQKLWELMNRQRSNINSAKEKLEQGPFSSPKSDNGTLSSHSGADTTSNVAASSDGSVRSSILAAARFQRTFLKLLKSAHFQGLSTRDLQLTSALNTDYLLTLPIEVDWKHTSSEVAIIFRRGYASERQEGLLLGAKFDYLQSLLLRKIFNWLSKPLFRSGTWINQKLKRSRGSDRWRSWADELAEWLKEPLKPEMDDDLSGIVADFLTDEEKEDYLPIWIAAQQAVPRYEAFLSSVGSRGMLLRKILVWMRILPTPSAKLSSNSSIDSTSLGVPSRGDNLARISMRDIWLPASKMVCGNNIWQQIRSAFSVLFSRSTLQEPAYKELVLLFNVPNAADDDREDKIPNLQLKIYGKIPIPDLKVIFPNKKLSFRILDTVRLDIATIIGLLAFLINYRFDDFLSSPSAFMLDIIASSALIVYITRVSLGYKQTYDRYQLLVNKTLYEKTLASGFGAAQFLVDASEQQQFKECILAFGLLLYQKNEKIETRESLAVKCEDFLFDHFKEQVEMPIDDALAILSRLGLIEEQPLTGSNFNDSCCVFQALPYAQSLRVLRERWTDLLADGSLPTSFLRSLYQTTLH